MVILFPLLVIAALAIWIGVKLRGTLTGASSQAGSGRIFYAQVHGIFHKNEDGTSRQKIITDCSVGEELELVPEPDNQYDKHAVKVCRSSGEQLGYWPAEGGGRMAIQLKRGERFRATIDEIYAIEDRAGKSGVKLRVEALE